MDGFTIMAMSSGIATLVVFAVVLSDMAAAERNDPVMPGCPDCGSPLRRTPESFGGETLTCAACGWHGV